jgi:hypothetical protein
MRAALAGAQSPSRLRMLALGRLKTHRRHAQFQSLTDFLQFNTKLFLVLANL